MLFFFYFHNIYVIILTLKEGEVMATETYRAIFDPKLDKLKTLRKSALENGDKEFIIRIDHSIEYLNMLTGRSPDKTGLSELDLLKYHSDDISKLEYYASVPRINKGIPATSIPNISIKQTYEIICTFFRRVLDDDLFDLFLETFNRKNELVHLFSEDSKAPDGFEIFLWGLKEAHIFFTLRKDISNFSSLAHEFGHAIADTYHFAPHINDSIYIFEEIISVFFELLCLDYMKKMRVFRDSAYNYNLMRFDGERKRSINILIYEEYWRKIENGEYDEENNTIDLVRASELLAGSESLDESIFERFLIIDELKYAISTSIAIKLFEIYTKDPKRALELIYDILKMNQNLPKEEIFAYLDDIGLSIDRKSIESYKEHIMHKRSQNF